MMDDVDNYLHIRLLAISSPISPAWMLTNFVSSSSPWDWLVLSDCSDGSLIECRTTAQCGMLQFNRTHRLLVNSKRPNGSLKNSDKPMLNVILLSDSDNIIMATQKAILMRLLPVMAMPTTE
jgi:hypothetical protein